MPFVSSVRGTFGPISENRGVSNGAALSEFLRQDPNSPAVPTGGTITTAGGYRIHTFTTVGSSTFSTVNYGQTLSVEYLVVAGGGGAGGEIAGGGGAGGYLSGTLTIPSSSQTITVGGGGAGGTGPHGNPGPNQGTSGSPTTFASITSTAGGGGGSYTGPTVAGKSGGLWRRRRRSPRRRWWWSWSGWWKCWNWFLAKWSLKF